MNVDSQTIADIELFSRSKNIESIYECYNTTVTIGGSVKLHKYLRNPVSNVSFLNERKEQIEFFCKNDLRLELNKRQIYFIEHYRKNSRFPLRANWIDSFINGIRNKIIEDADYYVIQEGVYNLIRFIRQVRLFFDELENFNVPKSLQKRLKPCQQFVRQPLFVSLISKLPIKSSDLPWVTLGKMDTFFRIKNKAALQQFFDVIYYIDVVQSMADLAADKNYSLANYSTSKTPVFEVEDCFHPFLDNPITNTFKFEPGANLCFLTGPNMSGKSTFFKTLGLIIYLAHVGFPVPAKRVLTSLQKGLFTTINLSDSLNLGYSHFYSEVKRVKQMALELQSSNKLFVVFDELFRGTNVKDAYDSTLMVLKSLSKIKNSIFFVSSHILEIAEELSEIQSIDFRCFESVLKNDVAEYNYKLKKGISSERVGFQIVKREKIQEILESIS